MIKLVVTKKEGGKILLFGLSKENIERLKQEQPIHFFLSEMGNYGKDEVMIIYGETEQSITAELKTIFPNLPDPSVQRKQ